MSNRRAANGAPGRVVLALTITARPGEDGQVQMTSQYDRETTVRLLRHIAFRYERSGPASAAGEDTTA